ncbi:hypothetical protein LTR84_002153 [Exophiala bonariae]|uniref:C2H2-type domain-containing protein n=1 Tax=Exophiala bonariae TaxID=1690606 RepID=A0AAV9ND62_9EURO|nr:hypothetical protein LTR84_002153 [Exophiala bonariae]
MSLVQDHQVEEIDFDTDILGRSPPLSAIKPHLGLVEDSPPPLVPYDPTPESSELEEEDKAGEPRRQNNRPDIANHAGRHPLDSQSDSEGGSESEEIDEPSNPGPSHMRSQERAVQNVPPVMHMQSMVLVEGAPVVTRRDDFPMVDPPGPISASRRVHTPPTTLSLCETDTLQRSLSCPKPEDSRKKEFDLKPPPLALDSLHSPRELGRGDEDSIVTSPALGRFAIKPQNADPDAITLPALHRSPPRSSPAGSPDNRQTLPSIRNLTIPHFNDPASMSLAGLSPMRSPHMTETPVSYLHSPHQGPGMSPPEHPSRYASSSWRSSTRDSSISTCSEYATPSSVSTSTPGSSIHLTQSPATSYPGPLSTLPEQEVVKQLSQEEKPLQDSAMDSLDLQDNSLIPGPFRCTFPGCVAIPFQTQYLLSSHQNVHSNQRPHFCPVKGCPRGVGGQGFKRKNEMIRHGLVHTSPGYICPFCADQQHRYPRPDNLQRHVRVHHEDVDRDDPLLRDVLNQRPEGGNRGRRRRMNP